MADGRERAARSGHVDLGQLRAAGGRHPMAGAAADDRPVFPLSGDEVRAAGVPQGPLVGKVMREVEAWWVDNDFTDDKLSLIERLKAVAQGMVY
jgi:tRNA nucleotidyltransferase/poly(A) polymerase